jgi:hypothetical protein
MSSIFPSRTGRSTGGLVCVSDIDDGLYVTWPEPGGGALARLRGAFNASYVANGGDRQVGRKLSSYMIEGDFDLVSVVVLPEAHHVPPGAGAEGSFIGEQLRGARQRVPPGSVTSG